MNIKKIGRCFGIYFAALVFGVAAVCGFILPIAFGILEILEK